MSVRQKFEQIKRRISGLIVEAEHVREKLTDDAPHKEVRTIEAEHSRIVSEIEGLAVERDALAVAAIDGDGLATRDLHALQQDDGAAIVERHIGQSRGSNMPEDRNLVSPSAATLQLLRHADYFSERSLAEQLIEAGESDEAVRAAVTEAHRVKSQAKRPIGGPRGEITRGDHNANSLDNPTFLRSTLEDALLAKMGEKPTEAARQFMGARREDFENILAEARGERRDWLSRSSGNWFGSRGGQHTPSDFSNLLLGAGNRLLQSSYMAAVSPLTLMARVRESVDFRPINVLKISEAPSLEEVNESGEITYGTRGEEKEAFALKTLARIFAFSRQAQVNDDLGAFGDFNRSFGRAAGEAESKQIAALFTANSGDGATLEDGNPLFSTTRGNKAASGSAINTGSLGGARQKLRETKGLDGVTPIGMTPRYLVVGPAIETAAEQALAEVWAGQTSNANPFSGKLELLVEPRFTGNAWRVFADPAQQSVLSIAYLNGKRGPILQMREGWTTLGMEFRAVLDFGCGITDWRGAYLDPGA